MDNGRLRTAEACRFYIIFACFRLLDLSGSWWQYLPNYMTAAWENFYDVSGSDGDSFSLIPSCLL